MFVFPAKQKIRYSQYDQSLPHHQEELPLPILKPPKFSLQFGLNLEQVYYVVTIVTGLTMIYSKLISN